MLAREVGITLEFFSSGVNEAGIVAAVKGPTKAKAAEPGDVIVRVDPCYSRPAGVGTLLGDPSKAYAKLGWVPEISVEEMCAEMVAADLDTAKSHALLKAHGHTVSVSRE